MNKQKLFAYPILFGCALFILFDVTSISKRKRDEPEDFIHQYESEIQRIRINDEFEQIDIEEQAEIDQDQLVASQRYRNNMNDVLNLIPAEQNIVRAVLVMLLSEGEYLVNFNLIDLQFQPVGRNEQVTLRDLIPQLERGYARLAANEAHDLGIRRGDSNFAELLRRIITRFTHYFNQLESNVFYLVEQIGNEEMKLSFYQLWSDINDRNVIEQALINQLDTYFIPAISNNQTTLRQLINGWIDHFNGLIRQDGIALGIRNAHEKSVRILEEIKQL